MTSLLWQVLVAAFFFICSAVFSASETALVSLSRPRLKKLISQRRATASALSEWLVAPQYLLTTLLVGNTLSNVLVTVLATNAAVVCFPHRHHGVVEAAVWIIMVFILFIGADLIPKTIARRYPEWVSLACLPWVSRLNQWSMPLIRAGMGFFKALPLGIEGAPVGSLSVYTVEEIREMIRASAVEGAMPIRSSEMMERALSLNRIPVSQIMTPFEKVDSVNLGLPPEDILDVVASLGRTRVPAYRVDPRKIGGYLHVKDLLLVWRGSLPLRIDSLLRQPLVITTTLMAGDLLEEFRKGASHLAVVVDKLNNCQGIVTLEDVLEEIIGETLDEYDLEKVRATS